MRALALLGVFIVAKVIILIGRPIELTGWTPIAYFWQDLLVAGIVALLDRVIAREWLGWTVYGAAVAYVAINVPVALVLSSPLTWPMLGAAGGALSDSIKYHATPRNMAAMCAVVATGIALPFFLRRVGPNGRRSLIIPGLLFVLLGPLATSRVDTLGRGRNAIMVLATTALPRIYARTSDIEADEQWRESPFGVRSTGEDLSRWKGAAAGRNVVLVSLESTGAQYLQPYGASRDPMPNLSDLARSALVFEGAYAVYPESIKGLFSVLCARYPAMDTASKGYAQVTTPSLAAVLKGAGYRTALFHSGRFMYLGMEAVVANRGYEILEDAGAIGGHFESSFGVDEPSTVNRALAWIDSIAPGERFFLTYLPIAGHHPYDTPEAGPFPERDEADRYLNALHYADAALGTLIQGLRARGLEDRTLFVVFGDHGEAFGQHDGNYGHSLFLYEENIHVPYLIAAPGLIDGEVRVGGAVSLIDTAPTIFDLVGLPAPAGYQGESALGDKPGMALFYTDYSLSLMGLRDGCWKYVYELDSGRSKLFDLCQDSAESKDLSDLYPERVTAYREHVQRWTAAQKALLAGSKE
ncbi:MAG TPA: sulfatase [Blastocatellia bacterium]|nr:sulfatase [Blastocatellia bacterium]